jgi:hypothetical protein
MGEAQNWSVRYLQKGDPKLERTRLLPSRQDALVAACALRQRHMVQYVEGPKGEKLDSDWIVKWCEQNSK